MIKRCLFVLLALILLAGCGRKEQAVTGETPAEAPAGGTVSETAPGTETASVPQAGQVINGFEALEVREFAALNASVVRFVHRKTGAELYYIANDDTNRVFDLTFRTEAPDDTGLLHVFEHAILSGSEKYPSRQLYNNLEYQTYNT